MSRSKDRREIDEAIEFIVSRTEEQACRENIPLDSSERLLLKSPPEEFFACNVASESGGPVVPNAAMDRIVRLVICACEYDETSNSDLELQWNLATVLLKIAGHPVARILEAADLKPQVEVPWWDRWLLWLSALVVIIVTLPVMILTNSELAGGIAFFVLLGIVYLLIRRQEHLRLEHAAAKFRQALSRPTLPSL